jgi:precorrin-6B methylase 1
VPTASLTIVGTGIAAGSHLTAESRGALERADRLLYLVTEPVAASWLSTLNATNRSLSGHYRAGATREEIYAAMVDEILAEVRAGGHVCVAFYGHPAVFVRPAHDAVRRARGEGFEARMLPAVSALDCLFADLGIDPADTGLQSYEATEFLLHERRPDPSAAMVLWQVSVIGQEDATPDPGRGLSILADYLGRWYPGGHEVVLYEASPYPIASAAIQRLPLVNLGESQPSAMATLYVPPARVPRPSTAMLERLGLASFS